MIDNKFINKEVSLFMHQMMCREEKNIRMLQQGCKIAIKYIVLFKNNTEAATGGVL